MSLFAGAFPDVGLARVGIVWRVLGGALGTDAVKGLAVIASGPVAGFAVLQLDLDLGWPVYFAILLTNIAAAVWFGKKMTH